MTVKAFIILTAILTTRVSQYGEGIMRQVLQTRIDCPAWLYGMCIDEASVPKDWEILLAAVSCDEIGNVYWFKNPVNGFWEKGFVVDCASPYLLRPDGQTAEEWMDAWGIGFEVDYDTAKRWQLGKSIPVVYYTERVQAYYLKLCP